MKTKKLIFTAVLTAAALVTFVIESQIPPLTPIYGIKLGLSNIFTLFALYAIGIKEAALLMFVRVTLGNILTGQIMAYSYSLAGGVLSFVAMIILMKFISVKQLWVTSAISAVFHNIGQIAVAVMFTGTVQIMYYLPILVVSGIVTGIFTGLCAQAVLIRLDKQGLIALKYINKNN